MDYTLNGVSYQTPIMVLSDAPRHVRKETEKSAEDETQEVAGLFQSKLK